MIDRLDAVRQGVAGMPRPALHPWLFRDATGTTMAIPQLGRPTLSLALPE